MTSVAQRRKRRKQKLAELRGIERKDQPRENGRFVRVEDDPRKTALEARERILGICTIGKGRNGALDPLISSPMGCVIHHQSKKQAAARLWAVWQAYCVAERSYRLRYLGQSGHPKGASIQMVSEKVQTEQSPKIDVRTQEEKDAQAVRTWMKWQGLLGMLSTDRASALRQAERGEGRDLWRSGQPTQYGLWAYQSLLLLAHRVENGSAG